MSALAGVNALTTKSKWKQGAWSWKDVRPLKSPLDGFFCRSLRLAWRRCKVSSVPDRTWGGCCSPSCCRHSWYIPCRCRRKLWLTVIRNTDANREWLLFVPLWKLCYALIYIWPVFDWPFWLLMKFSGWCCVVQTGFLNKVCLHAQQLEMFKFKNSLQSLECHVKTGIGPLKYCRGSWMEVVLTLLSLSSNVSSLVLRFCWLQEHLKGERIGIQKKLKCHFQRVCYVKFGTMSPVNYPWQICLRLLCLRCPIKV